MRTISWFAGDKKKEPKRDAEEYKERVNREPDSFEVCERNCQEMRTTVTRYVR